MQSSNELRTSVSDLEAAASLAGTRLVEAERLHNLAARSAVASNDYASDKLATAERELTSARASYDRATFALSMARSMLAEAVAAEKAAAQAEARKLIEADIDNIETLAAKADKAFKAYSELLEEAYEAELATRRKVSNQFGPALGGPQMLRVTNQHATFLSAMRNRNSPVLEAWTAETASNAAKAIRAGYTA